MSSDNSHQGSNAERSRLLNRQAVMGQIHRAGAMGRAEIARALSLSTQAVSNIIAELEGDGLLLAKGRLSAGRGLPAMQYALNPKGGYALGVEIRPDAVFAALLDMQGEAIATERVALTDARPQAVLRQVEALYHRALKSVPEAHGRMLGAGVVMPGPFGPTGIAGLGTDLPDWQDVDPQALLSDALGLSVEVSNDANAAAMAERINGVAQGLATYAYLYFGAGLGLGLVSQGHLIRGAFGNAGEIGHIPIPGYDGTLETLLSRLSVQNHLRLAGKEAPDIDEICKLHGAGDPDLMVWLDGAKAALSHAIAIIENLFDPQTVILGGAMPGSLLDDLVANTPLPVLSVANRPDTVVPRVMRGTAGRMTATLGAAALVLNRTLTPHLAHAH